MTTATKPTYAFECISGGHVGAIKPGTKLEQEAINHCAKSGGKGITLGPHDCPWCVEDWREHQERMWNYLGCPNWDHEFTECICTPTPIPDSPYKGQVTGIQFL